MHVFVEAGIILKCKGDHESAVKFLENRQRACEIIEDADDEDNQDHVNCFDFFWSVKQIHFSWN